MRKERPTEAECPGEGPPRHLKVKTSAPSLTSVAALKMLHFIELVRCSSSPSGKKFQRNLGSGSSCHLQFKMIKDKIPPFFFFFLKILSLINLHTQHGAWTYDPEIKSCTLHRLSQPAAPSILFFFPFNKGETSTTEDSGIFTLTIWKTRITVTHIQFTQKAEQSTLGGHPCEQLEFGAMPPYGVTLSGEYRWQKHTKQRGWGADGREAFSCNWKVVTARL